MRSVVIIPARFSSSRYPGKPLVSLLGKPMVLWVAELSANAVGRSNVYIATEDKRIEEAVRQAGFQVIMTSDNLPTGTDRLAEASKKVEADIYINVQGDEPLVDPEDIIKVRDAKLANMQDVINGFSWVSNNEDPNDVNIPKVITNENDELVYMSRVALPGYKVVENVPNSYKKQVCIYAFTKKELESFHDFGRKSQLEHHEDIEILRFLELNKKIRMIETKPGSLAVDIPSDVPKVEAALGEKINK